METWLFGLSLAAAAFVMGMVLMALLVTTNRTDLRQLLPRPAKGEVAHGHNRNV